MSDLNTMARALVDTRAALQKARIQFSNRALAKVQGDDDPAFLALMQTWKERFLDLETQMDRDIAQISKQLPIVQHMIAVKGVGPMLATKVAAMIDITRSGSVSALWRYAGHGVRLDGTRDRLVKGEKAPFNIRLKTACYVVGGSFLKSNSPYRAIYDASREYYAAMQPDWTDGHRHNASLRRMLKIWLQHLWVTWRVIEGLPINLPYVHEKLGHRHIFHPVAFGWEPLYKRDRCFEL